MRCSIEHLICFLVSYIFNFNPIFPKSQVKNKQRSEKQMQLMMPTIPSFIHAGVEKPKMVIRL